LANNNPREDNVAKLQVTSSAFSQGEAIPVKYTKDGEDHSPPLVWSMPPGGTASVAVICDDPDAPRGTWVHWVLFNLPGDQRSLDEGIPAKGALADGSLQGKNDFGDLGYGGPSPPPGKPHRYFFKVYALDTRLALREGATKDQLLAAMRGHVLSDGELMGTYQR
jgi:Raf kinase inhibitor-like YbhB/YbcL family protein